VNHKVIASGYQQVITCDVSHITVKLEQQLH